MSKKKITFEKASNNMVAVLFGFFGVFTFVVYAIGGVESVFGTYGLLIQGLFAMIIVVSVFVIFIGIGLILSALAGGWKPWGDKK